jgi:hypothetical protein
METKLTVKCRICVLEFRKSNYLYFLWRLTPKCIDLDGLRYFESDNFCAQLGLADLFNASSSNFGGIADEPLYVSEVMQKSRIEVDEDGATAVGAAGNFHFSSTWGMSWYPRFAVTICFVLGEKGCSLLPRQNLQSVNQSVNQSINQSIKFGLSPPRLFRFRIWLLKLMNLFLDMW